MRRREFIGTLISILTPQISFAKDIHPDQIAEEFLTKTKQDNLESLILEYRFSTSHTFLGLDLNGYGRIELHRNKNAYDYTAQVRKLGGTVALLGKLGLVNLPKIDTVIEGKLIYHDGRFQPSIFKKRNKAIDEPEKVMLFTPDKVYMQGTDYQLPRTDEYCPISMFFNYILFDRQDIVEKAAIMNFSKGQTATRTEVKTTRENHAQNGNTYTHRLHLSSPLLDLIESDVEFSLREHAGKRLPTFGHVGRFIAKEKTYEVYIRLERAESS